MYWGRRVWIIKVVIFLRANFIQQDTNSFSISNRLGKVFFMIIQKIWNHPCQVYIISHLLPFNPPHTTVPKVSLHQMTLTNFKFKASIMHQTWKLRVNWLFFIMVHLFLILEVILKKYSLTMRLVLLLPYLILLSERAFL